jgi:hypothetical protein
MLWHVFHNWKTLLSTFQMISKGHFGVTTKESIYTTPLVYSPGVTNILGGCTF